MTKKPPSKYCFVSSHDVSSISTTTHKHRETTDKKLLRQQSCERPSREFFSQSLAHNVSWILTVFREASRHILAQKATKLVAGLAVFIVVLTTTLISAISSYSAVIITRFAELQVSEVDLSISPKSTYFYFNFTEFSRVIRGDESLNRDLKVQNFNSFAPRMLFTAVLTPIICHSETESTTSGNCKQPSQGGKEKLQTQFLIYNHDTEDVAEIGTFWPHPRLSRGEIYLTRWAAESIGVSVGDRIELTLNCGYLFEDILDKKISERKSQVSITLKIRSVLRSLHGKFQSVISEQESDFPNAFGEFAHFLPDIVDASNLDSGEKEAALNHSLEDTVSQVVLKIQKGRAGVYFKEDFTKVQRDVVKFASIVLRRLRYTALSARLPLLQKLERYKFLSLFIALLVQVVIVVFAILCFILLYSHLIYSVESRNMETGVMRLLGMRRVGVIHLTLAEVAIISVPFWGSALGTAQIIFQAVVSVLGNMFGAVLPRTISSSSIFHSCIVGLILPILASILPMQNALRTLPCEAFSWRRSRAKGEKISIQRKTGNMPIDLLFIAAICACYGFSIYYVFPKAMMEEDLRALLYLFEMFILSILSGIVLFFTNFDLPLALFLKCTILILETGGVHRLSKMSLITHRERNRKTFLMYSVSIAIVVYIQMSVNLQVSSLLGILKSHTGATFRVAPTSGSNREAFDCCKLKLEKLTDLPGVTSFTWVGHSIEKVVRREAMVSNVGGAFSTKFRGQAVLPGLLWATYPATYRGMRRIPGSRNNSDIFDELYTIRGSQSAVVHENLHKKIGLGGPGARFAARITYPAPILDDHYTRKASKLRDVSEGTSVLSALGEFSGLPGFHKNRYSEHQPSLVSFPTMARLVGGRYPIVDKLPLSFFLLRVDTSNITSPQMQDIERALKHALSSSLTVESVHYAAESIEAVNGLLQFGFLGVNMLVMIVCFFSLITSMVANAEEQRKETAVLRAVGIREHVLFRSSFAEAFSLLTGANILGIFAGWAVSQTQHYQQSLFLDINSSIQVPWLILAGTFAASILSSVLSAALSTRIGRNTIARDLCRV